MADNPHDHAFREALKFWFCKQTKLPSGAASSQDLPAHPQTLHAQLFLHFEMIAW